MSREPARRIKRLPPYAKDVPESRTVFISAGPDAWERARRWKWRGEPGMVAPSEVDPATLDWPVAGRNVALIAIDLPITEVGRLCRAILAAGARVIAVLHGPAGRERTEIVRPRDVA